MPGQLTSYRIFIASPKGLDEERKAFKNEIGEYNNDEALHRDVIFQAVGWEDTLPGMGRPQSQINEELKKCDFFVLILHDRWGSDPGDNPSNATSGTEEEYKIALECFKRSKAPMKQLVCLFKSVPLPQMADAGPELKKVINFKRKLEKEKTLLYSDFTSLDDFKKLIRKNLGRWLREDGNSLDGGYQYPQTPPETPFQPELETRQELATSEIISKAHELARQGKLVDAEIAFSKAIVNDPSAKNLLSYAQFLTLTGQLDKTMVMLEQALKLSESEADEIMRANTFNAVGIVFRIRGDLEGAEEMCRKALEINEKLGRPEGMASDYGNLGTVFQIRGDLEGAEEMYRKALEINEKLGHQEGMANQYGNLGIVLKTRGDLEGAEEMCRKALEINEKLGHQEGMANQYGNLGIVFRIRGDLDRAEEMYKKSLAIEEKLGRQEGMASDYGNLANVLWAREDLDEAEAMCEKALEIATQCGFKEIEEIVARNLEKIKEERLAE